MPLFKEQKKVEKEKKNRKLVTFLVAWKEYAIEIGFINEIIHLRAVNPLPGTSDYIEGIIDLRGKAIPLINLKRRLKLSSNEPAPSEHVLIVDVHQRKFGLIVDQVLQVITAEEQQIETTEKFMDRNVPYLRGVCHFKERLVFLLDLEGLGTEKKLSEIESRLMSAEPAEGLSPL